LPPRQFHHAIIVEVWPAGSTARVATATGYCYKAAPNTGYETLIYDCMIGDATLFQRANNIEAG
jgi:glucose-6-phosphate 1-dehydrogenase